MGLIQPKNLPSHAVELAKALDAKLGDAARTRLSALVRASTEQRVDFDVGPLLRDLELVSGRIGLLACSDVTVAARQVAIETRPAPGLTPAERVRDLLSFSVSESHAIVRSRLGMKVGETKSIPA